MTDEPEDVEDETYAEGLTPEQLVPGQKPYVDPPTVRYLGERFDVV